MPASDDVVKLSPQEEEKLNAAIEQAIIDHEQETSAFFEMVRLWHRFYELDAPKKDFPWRGASNINLPMIPTAIDQFKAKIKQTIRYDPELWNARPIRRGAADFGDQAPFEGAQIGDQPAMWKDVATAIADFCNTISDDDIGGLNINEVLDDWIDNLAKEGTAPVKIAVVDHLISARVTDKRGNLTSMRVVRSSPQIIPLSITECVWAVGIASIEEMWMFGHMMAVGDGQFRRFNRQLRYRPSAYKLAIEAPEEITHIVDDERARLEGVVPLRRSLHRLYILSVDWVLDNGDVRPLVVTWHRGSRQILRIVDSPLWLVGMKGYEVSRFERRGRRFLGRSPVANLVPLNRAMNTMINQTFDSKSAANAGIVLVKANSKIAAEIEKNGIYPGATFEYEESPTELTIVPFSQKDVIDTIALSQLLQQFAERVSRISDASVGQVQASKRTPASTGLTILQEGATMMDDVIARFRTDAGRAMIQVLYLYVLERPGIFAEVLGAERGELLRRALTDPEYPISAYLRVTLKATSSSRSRDLERQQIIGTVQILNGYLQQLMQLVPLMLAPNIPPEAKGVFVEILKPLQLLMRRMVEASKMEDPELLVPDLLTQIGSIAAIAEQTAQVLGSAGGSPDQQAAEAGV